MKFFKKTDDDTSGDTTVKNVAISSIIGKGMKVTGDVTFSGKLRLDGEVEGNINGEHLILGETGKISGDIDSSTCTCQGRVTGNIKSRDLNVIKGCRIEGNVETINLYVESGALLTGKVHVEDKDLRLLKGSAPPKEDFKPAKAENS